MKEKRECDYCTPAALLFVFFVPVLSSLFDSRAVLCVFCALCLFAAAHAAYTKGVLHLSKTVLFVLSAGLFSFAEIIWVSDKGAQFGFSLIFAASAFFAAAVCGSMKAHGRERFFAGARKALYCSAVFYALVNVLYQIFIAESFFSYRMDLGSGSGYASAAFMLVGLMCAGKVRRGREKSPGFIAAMVLMTYVFLMAGSLAGYIVFAAVILAYNLPFKKRRAEAFAAAVALLVLSVMKIIYTVSKISLVKPHLSAALYGLSSVFGRGCNGYNAAFALLDKAYDSHGAFLLLLAESWGFVGIAAAVCAVLYAIKRYLAKPRIENFAALAILIGVLISSSAQAAFSLPLLAAYYAAQDRSTAVRVHSVFAALPALAGVFLIYLAAARVPFALGRSAYALGDFAAAAARYETGAEMELFSSEGWEKAYEALESGGGSYDEKKLCLENAMRFNPKNLDYSRKLAKVYADKRNYGKALEIWDGIIEKCDEEYLYPEYSEAILGAMEVNSGDLEAERLLYEKLSFYAEKCVGDETKKSVNDILSKAQRYYVASIEGDAFVGDMYNEAATGGAESGSEGYTEG